MPSACRARADDLDGLRVTRCPRNEEDIAHRAVRPGVGFFDAVAHHHRLGGSRCLRRASEAFAISSAVRSHTIVWKLSSISSRPCEISA